MSPSPPRARSEPILIVEKFPPTLRAVHWGDGVVGWHDLPQHVRVYLGSPPAVGEWLIWDDLGYDPRIVDDVTFRSMYQLPDGRPIP